MRALAALDSKAPKASHSRHPLDPSKSPQNSHPLAPKPHQNPRAPPPRAVAYGIERMNAEVAAWMRRDRSPDVNGFASPPFLAMGDGRSVMWNRQLSVEKWVNPIDRFHAAAQVGRARGRRGRWGGRGAGAGGGGGRGAKAAAAGAGLGWRALGPSRGLTNAGRGSRPSRVECRGLLLLVVAGERPVNARPNDCVCLPPPKRSARPSGRSAPSGWWWGTRRRCARVGQCGFGGGSEGLRFELPVLEDSGRGLGGAWSGFGRSRVAGRPQRQPPRRDFSLSPTGHGQHPLVTGPQTRTPQPPIQPPRPP